MEQAKYDVFIIYRHESGTYQAQALRADLENNHCSVFMDTCKIEGGDFEKKLLLRISEYSNFVVVISKDCFSYYGNGRDYFLCEIAMAFRLGKNVIPVYYDDMKYEDTKEYLYGIVGFQNHIAITYHNDDPEGSVNRIISFLKTKEEVLKERFESLLEERTTSRKEHIKLGTFMEKVKYDVFISYSRKDYVDEQGIVIPGNEVSKIKDALTGAGISYWFDEEGIYFGDKFTEKIPESIEASHIFLFLSTKNACASPWTSREIACADEYNKYIIPVRIDRTPYNKRVMFRIADLSYIDYGKNPEKGRQEIVNSIKTHLEKIKVEGEERLAEEKRKQEELERQRKRLEEEKKRLEKIAKIETEIDELESKKTEYKKAVSLAQADLEACEFKIQKLQKKLQELREQQIHEQKRKEEEIKAAEEKRCEEESRNKERIFTVGDVSFKMIRVEGGNMGTFYIGENQVTQALWQAVMGDNPSWFEGQDYPVERVSWNDICGEDGTRADPNCFLYKLNQKTGKNFRLPKEAEWEYAAKGGNKSKNYLYAGSNKIVEVAWYWKNSEGLAHPVKKKSPNELGIYDMSGNVWEWCEDLPETSGSFRVLCGGSYVSDARECRVSNRISIDPNGRLSDIGFRLVLPL